MDICILFSVHWTQTDTHTRTRAHTHTQSISLLVKSKSEWSFISLNLYTIPNNPLAVTLMIMLMI